MSEGTPQSLPGCRPYLNCLPVAFRPSRGLAGHPALANRSRRERPVVGVSVSGRSGRWIFLFVQVGRPEQGDSAVTVATSELRSTDGMSPKRAKEDLVASQVSDVNTACDRRCRPSHRADPQAQEGPRSGCQGTSGGPGTGQEHSARGPQQRRPRSRECPLGCGKVQEGKGPPTPR